MTEQLRVLWIFGAGMGLAALLGFIVKKFRISPIIGYLLAGFMIGPKSPGFIADPELAEQLAHIGVTLLMFAVGLQFNWGDLLKVRRIALPGALTIAAIIGALGFFLGKSLGFESNASLILAISLVVSSTVVIVRLLSDYNLMDTKSGHIVVGWTVVEDLISIFALIILPSLAGSLVPSDLGVAFGVAILKVMLLALVVYLVGEKIVDFLLKGVARMGSHELFTVATLALVFMIAAGSSYVFGVSIALGAFIAGTVIGKTELSHQAAANALPMRDAFSVIFFLSVGMLLDPNVVMENLPLFFSILALVLLVKPLLAFLGMKLGGYAFPVAATVALAIGQIGEYSFILIEEGSRLGLVPDDLFDVVVAVSLASIVIVSLLFQSVSLLPQTRARRGERFDLAESFNNIDAVMGPKAIVAGFGPIGRAAAETLVHEGYQVQMIERNVDTVTWAKRQGIASIYGDASQTRILELADINDAELFVIAVPDHAAAYKIFVNARYLNPYLKFVIRIRFEEGLQLFEGVDFPIICDETLAGASISQVLANYLK